MAKSTAKEPRLPSLPRTTVKVSAPSFSAIQYRLSGWNCTPASLSTIVTVATFRAPRIWLVGLLRVTRKALLDSFSPSLRIGIVNVWTFSPAAKSSVFVTPM